MEDATRNIFAAEATELLSDLEKNLLVLESDPEDQEAINSAFRAMHTIKGTAGIMDIADVEAFAHTVEGALENVRAGELRIGVELASLLLQSKDIAAAMIGAWIDERPVAPEICAARDACIERLVDYLVKDSGAASAGKPAYTAPATAEAAWHISVRFGPDDLRSGIDPMSTLSYIRRHTEALSVTAIFDSMPPAPEMDPEICYAGAEMDVRTALPHEAIEEFFELASDGSAISILRHGAPVEEYASLVLSRPEDKARLAEVVAKGGAVGLEPLLRALGIKVTRAKAVKAAAGEASRASSTIRVETAKLDALINMIGELLVTGSGIDAHSRRLRDQGLSHSADSLSRLISDIRTGTMAMRMVPLAETMDRLKRAVHDIARETGKDVRLALSGGETELDKTLVEKVRDPLMHIIRNSIDHGIEPPEERARLGKPAWGTLSVRAYQDTGDVVIEIADDGRGLVRAELLKKAAAIGLANPNSPPPDSALHAMIFEAGFSTASEVTSLSGRGVGMDVVYRNITSLGGAVELENAEGRGLTVRIRIPLTLAIIEGFLVEAAGIFFVLPMDTVLECIEIDSGTRRHITLRGSALPYISIRDALALGQDGRPPQENVVIVRHAGRGMGLVVDRLHGAMQVVVKGLGTIYKDKANWVSGAAIMGEGSVALILDVPKLVSRAIEAEGQ